ncbi:hypothetical protein G3I20_22670 [Streptomyces sp. SID8111]|uniref:HNH endonuclease n=1 Tax=Streptomyces sp. SID8111 TaxID=2706100 RepID=UPI0013BF3E5D|nr:HNH endonuclease [Streptomyces sp. SID8111]NEC29307.1 hypothetical protein [Streptomyces sp. SID8111]
MAGALAAAERTALHGTHIKAAWSLARRAVKDTCRLVSMDRDMVHQIVEYVDDTMRRVSTSEGQASPVLSNTPEGQTYGEYAHGNRSPSGINAVRKLKQWYQDSCQICATTLVLPSPRHRYNEAAHIRAKEDGGPDLTENLLCLCPNCHVRFDGGALVLTDDLTVVDTVKDRLGAKLRRHQWHYCRRTSERAPPRTDESAPLLMRWRGVGRESAAVGSGWQGGGWLWSWIRIAGWS